VSEAKLAARQRLLEALHGPGGRPRDVAGRFVSRPSFDPGARPTPPMPADPVAEHGRLLGELLGVTRAQRGRGGWFGLE
jgi:hypothetical protein